MDKAIKLFYLVILSIFAFFLIIPIYWMIKGGFEPIGSVMKVPPSFIVRNPTLKNYSNLLRFPVLRWTLNSVVIASAVTIIGVSTSCLAGYAFAKKQFPGKNILFWILLSTLMVPLQVRIIPLFIMVKNLGFYNTYPGVFLPMCCMAVSIFLARQYMSTIPSELIYAGRLDGASEFKIFISIIIPNCKPLIAALSILTFIGAWGNFLWPLLMTSSDTSRTLPIGVVGAAAMPANLIDIGMAMAGATLVAIPLIIVFLNLQRYFIKGITLGNFKK